MTTHHFTATDSNGRTFTFEKTFTDFDDQARFFAFARTAQQHGFTFQFKGTMHDWHRLTTRNKSAS